MKIIRQVTLILIAAFLWNTASFGQSQSSDNKSADLNTQKRVATYGGDVTLLPLTGETITVTTLFDVTDFSGAQQVGDLPGPDGRVSFREAVTAANNTPGPQTIAFAIPVSEFWLVPNVALLKLEDGAFFLRDAGTTVDFSTQTVNIGDTNPNGPEVGIYGLEPNGWGIAAIFVNGNNCVIKGLGKVYQRGYAVEFVGDNNRLIGSQITGPLHAAINIEGYGSTIPTGNIVGGTALGDGNELGSLTIRGPADDNIVIGNIVIGGGVSVLGRYALRRQRPQQPYWRTDRCRAQCHFRRRRLRRRGLSQRGTGCHYRRRRHDRGGQLHRHDGRRHAALPAANRPGRSRGL